MEFVAFDLETTGTDPRTGAIVEIGAIRFRNGEAGERFGELIDPKTPIPPAASRVNGITDEMVQGKPRIEDVAGPFAQFCGSSPLVAHNAPFDFRFLSASIRRFRLPAPGGPVLDSLTLARKLFPGLPNYRLGTLVRHFDFPSGVFHRAEEDSAYCGLLFVEILRRLEARGEQVDESTLIRLGGRGEMRFPQYKAAPDQLDLF